MYGLWYLRAVKRDSYFRASGLELTGRRFVSIGWQALGRVTRASRTGYYCGASFGVFFAWGLGL